MVFENCTDRLKAFQNGLGQRYNICSFEDITQSRFLASLCLQITAEVSKITKSAPFNLTYIFIELSETANSFVIQKRWQFHKNKFVLKTRLLKSCKIAET